MTKEKNYIEINRQSWNNRTDTHLKSEFYDLENFIKGKNSLNSIELELLGNITGKNILHLQCHFGQDTISLSRLGATCTGVDLSDKAIESAKQIAKEMNADANFICCDIYDLPSIWIKNLILYLQAMAPLAGCPTWTNGLRSFPNF